MEEWEKEGGWGKKKRIGKEYGRVQVREDFVGEYGRGEESKEKVAATQMRVRLWK